MGRREGEGFTPYHILNCVCYVIEDMKNVVIIPFGRLLIIICQLERQQSKRKRFRVDIMTASES